uniref:Uncharacterized protein n=1 Tax=viral metagenome TaxID=1070528 RepID=A0A6H1ZP41_9ZZZZ
MGAILPIAIIIAAYIGTTAAVIAAVTTVTVVAIAAAVIAVAATAASTYFYVQGDIKNSMLMSGIALAAGIGGIYLTYTNIVGTQAALMAEGTAHAIAAAEAYNATAVMTMATWVHGVYSGWQTISSALHLDMLYKIHQIAYLVSEDYRLQWAKIYQQVNEVGTALGMGAHTLNLLFENARTAVLDISTGMGKRFDLAEVTWLSTYNEMLKEWDKTATQYAKNPENFIWWITQNVYRPGYDAKASAMLSIMRGVDSALGLVKSTAETLTKVRNDVMKLIGDLPEVIRKEIMPKLEKVVKEFDDFMKLTYDPTMKMINSAFAVVGKDLDEQKEKARLLTDRLKRPGHYLKEIDSLPDAERHEDELTLADIANRQMNRGAEDFAGMTNMFESLTDEDIERGIEVPEPPAFPKAKFKPYKPLEPGETEKKDSPFVGDY